MTSRTPLLDRINGRKPAPRVDTRDAPIPEWRRRQLEGKAQARDLTGLVLS